jgi:hypothetical protein
MAGHLQVTTTVLAAWYGEALNKFRQAPKNTISFAGAYAVPTTAETSSSPTSYVLNQPIFTVATCFMTAPPVAMPQLSALSG